MGRGEGGGFRMGSTCIPEIFLIKKKKRIRMVSDFLMVTFKDRRCGFKVLRPNYFEPGILYLVKLLIRCEGRKKDIFSCTIFKIYLPRLLSQESFGGYAVSK